MYDPKFSIKQMYDQYGSSRSSSSSTTTTAGPRGYTRKSTPAPTPKQRTDRGYVPTNIAAPKSTSRTDRTAPPRAVDYSKGLGSRAFKPETEELSTWEKVKSAFTNTMEKFGIFDEPDTTTTPDAVYKDGNLFSPEPYIPDTSRFKGDTQLTDMTPAILKDYASIYKREGDISPTLPTGTDNPILNVFGVERGFTRSPAGPQEAPTMEQPEMPDTFRDSIQKAVASALVPRRDTKEYTIKAGDTLSEIAEREGTTVKALADMNGIPESDVDMIRAGETLKIPAKKEIRASTRGQGLMSPQPVDAIDSAIEEITENFYNDIGTEAETDHGDTPVPTKDAKEKNKPINQKSKDVGYGHKVKPSEEASGLIHGIAFKNADGTYIPLTESQKRTILKKDMEAEVQLALKKGWNKKLSKKGTSWDNLDYKYKNALSSLAFNVGGKKAGEQWDAVLQAAKDEDPVAFAKQLRRQDAGKFTAGMDNRVMKELYYAGIIESRKEVASVLPKADARSGVPR